MRSEETAPDSGIHETCTIIRDKLLEVIDERNREHAENNRLRLALGAALPALEQHGEHRLCALIRTAAGDCSESALAICGPVLIVSNS